MSKLVLAVMLLTVSFSAMAFNNWSSMSCRGIDSAGRSVYLSARSDSDFVTINGDNLRIVGKTVNGRGVVTERFVSVVGTFVYDSIVPVTNTSLTIYQFNAVTQALLATASLNCGFSGNEKSEFQVSNQKIFSSLKS